MEDSDDSSTTSDSNDSGSDEDNSSNDDDSSITSDSNDSTPLSKMRFFPTVPFTKPSASALSSLLFSEDFSDVRFVCQDEDDKEVLVPAHRNILAAYSPYFKTAFSSTWKNSRDDKLETSHSAKTIKAMLTMMYTGEENGLAVSLEPLAFMDLATEYNLDWLRKLAEHECACSVNRNNLKQVWVAGRLYDSNVIKKACIAYAKANLSSVFADGIMSRLQFEDTDAWQEFAMAFKKPSSNNRKKRKRSGRRN